MAVVGAGLMGSQIGCEYALGGHRVTYLVRDLEASRTRVEHAFAVAREAGLANGAVTADDVAYVTTIEAIDDGTDIVVESIDEVLETKAEVLAPIAQRLPEAIIGSNTSSIPLTALGDAIGAPERTIGTHYWNPPLLMPPVEIIRGERTRQDVVDRVRATIEALGKEPLIVERDVPGFVWNRLQLALLREVLWLVENGVATPRAIDNIVSSGLARRLRFTGPFETIALGGVHSWTSVAENLFPVLSNATEPSDIERWLDRSDEELAEARARRDRGLAEELAKTRASDG